MDIEIMIKDLNDMKIIQENIDWAECIPDGVWAEIEGNFKTVDEGLLVDTRRWYELSVTVIEIDNIFIGIEHITNLFSESSSCEDCCHTVRFFKMKPIQVTTYEREESTDE